MRTLALISQKGGAGKTTLALHLAVEAERRGIATLLLDLDPQASARAWADRRESDAPEVVAAPASRLPHLLEAARGGGARLVVLDTPPHADQSALAAMRAANLTLAPVRPSILDLDSVQATLDLAEISRSRLLAIVNHAPAVGGAADEARAVLERRGVRVAAQAIRQRVAFQHGVGLGLAAQEYEPEGKAAAEIAVLFDEIAPLVGLPAGAQSC